MLMHSSKAQVGWPWACVSCHPPKGFHQSSETGLKWSQKYAAVESSALSSVLVGLHPRHPGDLRCFTRFLPSCQRHDGGQLAPNRRTSQVFTQVNPKHSPQPWCRPHRVPWSDSAADPPAAPAWTSRWSEAKLQAHRP